MRDVHVTYKTTDDERTLNGVILQIRAPKEAQYKNIHLSIINPLQLCPVRTLQIFITRTSHLRSELRMDHTVFLAYLADPTKVRSISPVTVANIVKENMKAAGIDTALYTTFN